MISLVLLAARKLIYRFSRNFKPAVRAKDTSLGA
jgi:hypothetical protein